MCQDEITIKQDYYYKRSRIGLKYIFDRVDPLMGQR